MTAQHILVVDDEPEIRNAVKDILEDEGFDVSLAESAAEARQQRKQQAPDLVLLDIWMPEEDGVSLLKDWKQNDDMQTPVVMMSGHGTVETAVEATRNGAFDFIEKPLSLAKLLRVTNQALESATIQKPTTSSRVEVIEPVEISMQKAPAEINRLLNYRLPASNPLKSLPSCSARKNSPDCWNRPTRELSISTRLPIWIYRIRLYWSMHWNRRR